VKTLVACPERPERPRNEPATWTTGTTTAINAAHWVRMVVLTR
jgi:hypothetical protein